MTPHDAHREYVAGCRECLREVLDRAPDCGTWRDFEPQAIAIVECVGGWRIVARDNALAVVTSYQP